MITWRATDRPMTRGQRFASVSRAVGYHYYRLMYVTVTGRQP